MKFLGFPSIEGFHNVVKAVGAYPHIAPSPVKYRGKIKLHGTNAAVRVADGEVAAQSRTQLLSVGNDNAGFAAWVEPLKEYWLRVWKGSNRGARGMAAVMPPSITVFGEWCGPGIMKGTAVNNIQHKIFAVFAVMVGENIDYTQGNPDAVMVTEPAEIAELLANDAKPSDVHVLPWEGDAFSVDFSSRDSLEQTATKLNAVVEQIEPADPWVKQTFGVDGIAEGVVYVPGAGEVVSRKTYSDLAFKAKGEKHKVVKTKQSVQVDPEVAKGIGDFVSMFVTEARLEQGVATLDGGTTNMKNIGPFIKWVSQDVQKESADEMEASGLAWEQVEKHVQTAARNYFLTKHKSL